MQLIVLLIVQSYGLMGYIRVARSMAGDAYTLASNPEATYGTVKEMSVATAELPKLTLDALIEVKRHAEDIKIASVVALGMISLASLSSMWLNLRRAKYLKKQNEASNSIPIDK